MADNNKSQTELSFGAASHDALEPIPGVELFFGLVGPTGTDTSAVCAQFQEQLRHVGYACIKISLSKLIGDFVMESPEEPTEYSRIRFLMKKGTQLRETFKTGDFVARLALAEIRAQRTHANKDPNKPIAKTAYIISSFKRPEEVQLFREIYGKAFNLVSIYSSTTDREVALSRRLASSAKKSVNAVAHQAVELINIDASEEGSDLGQDVRDTFPLADYFIEVKDGLELKSQLRRLVQLVFGNPYLTPTKDENAMFFAQAAALRSGDLSRQVGATIISNDGEVISTGCNEVPKAGGGLYWADDPFPKRDLEIGFDKNSKVKQELVEDMMHRLQEKGWLNEAKLPKDVKELFQAAALNPDAPLLDCQLLDVLEYGRTVHAEMAAITEAARRGHPIKGARLFTTTFPCHICARHIISAGISEVVYVEPYPKSRTQELYSDSVVVNPKEPVVDKVNFVPFSGVAPRRYFDFFQVAERRKTARGEVLDWEAAEKQPKVKRFVLSYVLLEQVVVKSLPIPESRQEDMKNEPKEG